MCAGPRVSGARLRCRGYVRETASTYAQKAWEALDGQEKIEALADKLSQLNVQGVTDRVDQVAKAVNQVTTSMASSQATGSSRSRPAVPRACS